MTDFTSTAHLKPVRLGYFAIGIMVVWTLFIALSMTWHFRSEESATLETARIQARTVYNKDVLYRLWNTNLGGVYAEVTPSNPPNPYLEIFERDIVTPSHRKLTLINPAYMTRQVHELEMEKTGVRGHITSLNPIRPENAPDQWEREALLAFQDGSDERSGVEVMEGQQYVRLMRPLITEKGCLKCHAVQGYKVGDIRGGISVAVPFAPYLAIQHRRLVFFFVTGGIIWLAGLIGIGTGGLMIRHQLHYRLAHEAELRNMAKLQGVLELSGAVCHELNQPIQAISGYSELMLMSMGNDNPLHRKASAIKQQVERMSTITAKLNSITHYASKDYSRRKIIDIDSASK
jgi:hypothetical protein